MHRVLLFLLLALLPVMLVSTGLAGDDDDGQDIIILKQGGIYKGKIISQTGVEVKIMVKGKIMVFKRSDIRKIILAPKPIEEYKKRADQLTAGDAKAQYELALWCRQKGFEKEAEKHLRAVIKADPDHAGAREALGFTKHEGRWFRALELKQMGLVQIGGKWITPDKLEEALAERRTSRLDQLDGIILQSEQVLESVTKGYGYSFKTLQVRGEHLYRDFQRDQTRLFVVRIPFAAPLSLPALGQETCQALFDARTQPADILGFLVSRGGGKTGGEETTPAVKASVSEGDDLLTALKALWTGASQSCEGGTLADLKSRCEKLPAPLQQALARLLNHFTEAVLLRRKAFEEVVLDDLMAIVPRNEFGSKGRLLDSYDLAREVAFLEQYPLLPEAARVLMKGASGFARFMKEEGLAGTVGADAAGATKELFRVTTPYGEIVVGGVKDNEYKDTAALLIDLGGNDTYMPALPALPALSLSKGALSKGALSKGAMSKGPGVTLLLDLDGNDQYISEGNDAFGSGYFGVGVHIDLEGNDIYSSKGHSLGSAFVGCGVLYDGSGDDEYVSGSFGQGCAHFGYGLLIDGGGKDRYTIDRIGQGFGGTCGVGLLLDVDGDDVYNAGKDLPEEVKDSYAQGAARGYTGLTERGGTAESAESVLGGDGEGGGICISGGWGILADLGGRDSYEARGFAQGASSWSGLGMLLDRWGDDTYQGARMVQGAGSHLSSGLLLDCEGDDQYTVSGMGLGFARHFGVGALVDCFGDDHFQGTGKTLGSVEAMNCLGLFLDCRGNDRYGGGGASFGFASEYSPPAEAAYKTLGIFLDLGGEDAYRGRVGPENNMQWDQGEGIGIGLDQEEG